MNARLLAAVLLGALSAGSVHAGHGFMNSFADVEWLPDPGYTPDGWRYTLDRLGERAELGLAAAGEETMTLCLEFAREKLAETSAMIRTGNADAATIALGFYADYIGRAAAAVDAAPAGEEATLRARYIKALLEHVYVMSVDYMDMPLGIRRTTLTPLFTTAMQHFDAQRAALSKGEQNALFFREEEIRWALEMTKQADLQGITN